MGARSLLLVALVAGCNRESPLSVGDSDLGVVGAPDAATMAPDLAPPPTVNGCTDRPARVDCGPYAAACNGATPIAGGSDNEAAGAFAIDDRYLYWQITRESHSEGCDGAIMRTDKSGGPSTVLVQPAHASEIVVDDSRLYWLEGAGETLSIASAPKSGGPPSTVTMLPRDINGYQDVAYALTLDGDFLDWGTWDSTIRRVAKSGGPVTDLATNLYGPPTHAMALVGDRLYWAGDTKGFIGDKIYGALYSVPTAGGPVTTVIADSVFSRGALATAGGRLYFVDGTNSTIKPQTLPVMSLGRALPSGAMNETIVASDQTDLETLIADDAGIVWSELTYYPRSTAIRAASLDGSAPRQLWSGPVADTPQLASDGTSIYFFLPVGPPGNEIYGFRGGLIVRIAR